MCDRISTRTENGANQGFLTEQDRSLGVRLCAPPGLPLWGEKTSVEVTAPALKPPLGRGLFIKRAASLTAVIPRMVTGQTI